MSCQDSHKYDGIQAMIAMNLWMTPKEDKKSLKKGVL